MTFKEMNEIREAVLKAGGTYAEAIAAVIAAVQAMHNKNRAGV